MLFRSESITRSILQRSEGVFLYAEFICNSIDSKEIDPLDINHFPKGLYNVYEDYFQRRFPDIQQYKSGVAHLLRLIVAAKEPLLIDDINNFLESKLDDWDEECFEDMRKSLGSLFVLIDDTIVPFHKSIIDWLVQNRESDYYINRKKANRNMIEWGERMIKSRRGVSEYFLKHLLAHYVYDKQFDSAIDLLQNQIYFNLQVAMLGFDQTIRLYFDNLLLFHDYSPQSVVLVLQSSFFIQLINNYRRYFLDNGYYMDIKAMGFDQVVDSLLKHEDLKIIITAVLYYYYSLENFNRVIKLTEQYVIDNQLYE